MAALTKNKLARTTARFGAMRFGAFRFGYAPRDTINAAGTAPGPLVRHTRTYPAAVVYTVVKR